MTTLYNPYSKQIEQRPDVELFLEKYKALCKEYDMQFVNDMDTFALWRVSDEEIDLGSVVYIWFKDEVT